MTSLLSLHIAFFSCLLFNHASGDGGFPSRQNFQVSSQGNQAHSRGNFFKAKLALRSDAPDDDDTSSDTLNTNAITYDNKPTFLNLKQLARPSTSLIGFRPTNPPTTTTTTTTSSPETPPEDEDVTSGSSNEESQSSDSSPFIRQVPAPSFASRADLPQFFTEQQRQQGVQKAPAIFGEPPRDKPVDQAPVFVPFSQNSGQMTFTPAAFPQPQQNQQGFINPAAMPLPRQDQPQDGSAENFFEQQPNANGQPSSEQQQVQSQFRNPQEQFQSQQFPPQFGQDQFQGFPQGQQQQFNGQQFDQQFQQQPQQFPPQFAQQGSEMQFPQIPNEQPRDIQQPAPPQNLGTDGLFIPPQQGNLQQSDPAVALQNPFMQQNNGQNMFQQAPLPGQDQFNQFQGLPSMQDPSQAQFGQPNQFGGQFPGQFNQPNFQQFPQQANQFQPQQEQNFNMPSFGGAPQQNFGTDGMMIPPQLDNNVQGQEQPSDRSAQANEQQAEQPQQAQQRSFEDPQPQQAPGIQERSMSPEAPANQARSAYGGGQPGYGGGSYGGGGGGGYGGGGAGGGGGGGHGGAGGGAYSPFQTAAGGGAGFGYPAGGSPYPYGAYGGFGYGYRPYYLGYNYDLAPYGIPQPQDFILYGKNTLHPEKAYYGKGNDYAGASSGSYAGGASAGYGGSSNYASGAQSNYDAPYGKAA